MAQPRTRPRPAAGGSQQRCRALQGTTTHAFQTLCSVGCSHGLCIEPCGPTPAHLVLCVSNASVCAPCFFPSKVRVAHNCASSYMDQTQRISSFSSEIRRKCTPFFFNGSGLFQKLHQATWIDPSASHVFHLGDRVHSVMPVLGTKCPGLVEGVRSKCWSDGALSHSL